MIRKRGAFGFLFFVSFSLVIGNSCLYGICIDVGYQVFIDSVKTSSRKDADKRSFDAKQSHVFIQTNVRFL